MSTHNVCFEQKCEKYQKFLSEKLPFLVVIFSVYLNRRVFVMKEYFLCRCINSEVKGQRLFFSFFFTYLE